MRILLVVLFLFFSLGEVARLSLTNAIAITGNDIAVSLFVLYGCFLFWNKKGFFQKKDMPFIFLLGVFFVSLAVNSMRYAPFSVFVSLLYLFRFCMYLLVYYIVRQLGTKEKTFLTRSMVISGGVISVLGFVQYFFYPDLRNLYYAGWDEHLYRMFSTFLDPNFAGAFFVMYLLFLVGLFVGTKQTPKMLYAMLAVCAFVALVLTYSRSAYLMFGVSFMVFLFLQKQKKARSVLLGVFLLLPLLVLFSPKSEGTNLFRTASGFARLAALDNAFTLWRENPVFGVGFNAYRYAQEQHGFLIPTEKENHAGAGADNSFLFVLATSGIVGLGAYMYFWYSIIQNIYKNATASKKHAVILAMIVGLFVDAFFINSLFYPFLLEFLFIVLAVTGVTD